MRSRLQPHPDFRCDAVDSLAVEVASTSGGLTLTYALAGRLADLALPPYAPSARADELWRHTCFEAFLMPERGPAYFELNFAPSTQWAAYRFSGYREGMAPAEVTSTAFAVAASDGGFRLQASLALDLPPGPCRLALSAVIEETTGRKSYWALAHPPGRPDFHHAAGFVAMCPSDRWVTF